MKKHKIVDFFPFFAKLDKEKLELRYHILKDYVDYFVVAEADKSHSGLPLVRELEDTILGLNIPIEKFIIVNVDIPDDIGPMVKEIDFINCYEGNSENKNSVYARCRDRLIKDSLLTVLDKFDDDTVFIHSDSDEIINPKHIGWVSEIVKKHQGTTIIKIPLVNLQGKANLRVHEKQTLCPQMWDRSMFFCTKNQLLSATPTNIRSNVNNPFRISYVQIDNLRVEDMGWHFSWMGDHDQRKIKSTHYAHYDDKLAGLVGNGYNTPEMQEFIRYEPTAGAVPPSGETGFVLCPYDRNNLPKEIFLNSRLKTFFVGDDDDETDQLRKLVSEYSCDTNDPNGMFLLAQEYENLGQYAIAISFYLRAAEYTDYDELAYECLCRMGLCFDRQKNRDFSTFGRFYHAASLLPTRPEAYYMLSTLCMQRNNWVDALMYTNLTIVMVSTTGKLLDSFSEEFDLYTLRYNRAVCLYEMGDIRQSKEEFDSLLISDSLSDAIKTKIHAYKRTRVHIC